MKRCLFAIAALLVACALAGSVYAEALPLEDAAKRSQAQDALELLPLGEETGPAEAGDELTELSLGGEAQAAPNDVSDASDFEVDNKVIVKYNGTATDIVIPEGIKAIGKRVFKGKNITSVRFSSTMLIIGDEAFYGCNQLTQVDIPRNVTSIRVSAFQACKALKSVSLHEGLLEIEGYAFAYCPMLERIEIPKSVGTIGDYVFRDCTSLSRVTLNDGLKLIGGYMFMNCTSLKRVELPGSIVTIKDGAFSGCSQLSSVKLHAGLELIGARVFSGCGNLNNIVLPGTMASIGAEAFLNCTSLTGIAIPSGVKWIGYEAFRGCTGLTSISLPDSVVFDGTGSASGYGIFQGCSELTHVRLPNTMAVLPERMFNACWKLTDVKLPQSLQVIGRSAFFDCISLNNIVIPANVTQVQAYAFGDCYRLKNITINSDSIAIDGAAFEGIPSNATFYTHCETPATAWASAKKFKVYASPHKSVKVAAIKPTEQQPGRTAGTQCKYCGKVLSGLKDVKKLPSAIYLSIDGGTELELGSTLQLSVTFSPVDSGADVKWKSSNKGVLTVTQKGKVKPKRAGSATITVQTSNGKTDTLVVKVIKPMPKSVKILNGRRATMRVKDKLKLKVKIRPGYAVGRVTWSSSDESIATVSRKGVVKARAVGKVKITATTENNLTASIVIRVKKQQEIIPFN